MPLDLSRRIRQARPRVTLYARVSKDQRSGRSCNQQLTIGRSRVPQIDGQIVGEYSDNDRSASRYATKPREDWMRVEADIREGRTDVLWLWEFARGTRERLVWATLAEACQERGLFIMLDDRVFDTLDPDDMRYLDQLMADSVAESGRTRKRILRDISAQAELGAPHGPVGFGYRRQYDPDTGALLRQVIDPEQARIVRRMASELLAGHSLGSIARGLNEDGVPIARQHRAKVDDPRWRPTTVRLMLQQPSLMGRRSHRGRIISEGGWEPILTEEEWWAIRERLRDPARRTQRDTSVRHEASGIAVCDVCDAFMYVHTTGRQGVWAYQCSPRHGEGKSHVSRLKARLEEHVEALLVARFSMPDVLGAFSGAAADEDQVAADRVRLAELREELVEAQEAAARTGPGRLSVKSLVGIEAALQPEIERLEAATRPRRVDPLAVELADEDPAVVLSTWRSWSLEQRRTALRSFTEPGGIRVLRTGKTGRRKLLPSESVRIFWRGQQVVRGAAP